MALDGRVACTDRNHELAIRGTLAAGSLHPEDFRGGGRVIYHPGADPASPERSRFARILVADAAEAWEL